MGHPCLHALEGMYIRTCLYIIANAIINTCTQGPAVSTKTVVLMLLHNRCHISGSEDISVVSDTDLIT